MRSVYDNGPLPSEWLAATPEQKSQVIDAFQKCGYVLNYNPHLPTWFTKMSTVHRVAVFNHLKACGLHKWKPVTLSNAAAHKMPFLNDVQVHKITGRSFDFIVIDEASKLKSLAYDPKNRGKRMLPSMYTQLHDVWVRSSGLQVNVYDMNHGHLKATGNLLKESHGNVVARATDLLGRMAHHFRNQPEIVRQLESLCMQMQQVEVDEMYPIFKEIERVYRGKRPTPGLNLQSVEDSLE